MTEWGICFLKLSLHPQDPFILWWQKILSEFIVPLIQCDQQPCRKHSSIVRNQDIWLFGRTHLPNCSLGLWLQLNEPFRFSLLSWNCQLRWKSAASIWEQDACVVGPCCPAPCLTVTVVLYQQSAVQHLLPLGGRVRCVRCQTPRQNAGRAWWEDVSVTRTQLYLGFFFFFPPHRFFVMCSQAKADRQTDRWVYGTRVTDWEHVYWSADAIKGNISIRLHFCWVFISLLSRLFSPHFRVQKCTNKDETRTVKVLKHLFLPNAYLS